jgi:hypothetical protein
MLLWLGVAFMVIGLIVMWVMAIVDMWRRKDMSRGKMAIWVVVIILLPVLGTIVYYLARPPATQVEYRGEEIL